MKVLAIVFTALTVSSSPVAGSREDAAVQEFGRHLSQWRATSATDYVYEMRLTGAVAPDSLMRVKIIVRDGGIERITYAQSSEEIFGHWSEEARQQIREFSVGDTVDDESRQGFLSVHELFGLVAGALAEPAASVEVQYDRDLGYPTEVTIDSHELITDDKITYIVQKLKLPQPADAG